MSNQYLYFKNVIFLFLTFSAIISNAQSKKEQLKALKLSLDSLNIVLMSERNNSKQNNVNLNSKISLLEDQIKLLSKSIVEKEQEIQRKTEDINGLHEKIRELRDSIKNTAHVIDTIVWEIPDTLTWDQLEFNFLKLLLPINKFDLTTGKTLISRDSKILISYDYNYTLWFDQDEGNPLFYKEQDAINYFSKGLKDIEITENKGFIIKGKNASNQLIIIKGIYDEMASMQGRDKGEPKWLWSNTLIIKITADQAEVVEFNYISNLLINNFSSESIVYKY